jgi:uncharacterized protein
MENILVDADAFIALAKQDDVNHERAVQILTSALKKPFRFLTSNYVFAEVVTVLSQRVGHDAARAFIHEMKSPNSEFSLYWIDEDIENSAIEIFEDQTSKNVSFVDCTNIAIIRNAQLQGIFSFDKTYPKNNISFLQELI